MEYVELFWAFFIANLLGYGGGPATIPLIQNEVVDQYGWMNLNEFSELLAIANALPGPIATKLGGFIGYEVGGVLGVVVALVATIAPSAIAVIILLKFASMFKGSLQIKFMTRSVQPVIAILLGVLAIQFFYTSFADSGLLHVIVLAVLSFLCLERFKVHPALVILGALCYGSVFLSGLII
ncbi:chromate transporter [Bacillus piscicola]|uniref:chromate transporter n=1 Tax=Bacillus piscicola TaxID=1632684 RepID=UPI001F0949B2|nr:chromate transporter [Bacillus piscicola]